MSKVRNIEVLIITREHSANPTSLPVYQEYLTGALSVQGQVNLAGTVAYSSWEANGTHPDFPSLEVRRYPTILFIDDATGKTLIRIEGNSISAGNVAKAMLLVNGWERDDSSGQYLNAEGEELRRGGDGVFSILPGEGENFGIPPIDLPNSWWWIVAGLGAYFTAGARNQTQQVLMGAGTLYAVSRAARPSGSLGRIDPPGMGKITDTMPIKPGSRVDRYWDTELEVDLKNVGNRKTWIKKLQPSAITSAYNLHSVEFGNWVNQQERLNALNGIAVSLGDLAKVLNVTQKKLGFGKRLAIAYGARGRGGNAAATYHPSYHLINLTKTAGEGSLAHEYGHAIDYHAGRKLGFPPSGGDSTTKQILERSGGSIPELFEKVFEALYWDDNGRPTDFQEAIKGYPKYWQQRNEVWARTFEAWVNLRLKDLKLKNEFLAKSSAYKYEVYPTPKLLRKAEPYIRKIVTKVIGR